MPTPYDVIVLGLGGFGSAACAHLAQRNVRVLGIDQFPLGHQRGSSHGESRIIRQAYFEHPDYVPLLRRAYELWSELEQASGTNLYRQTGLLLAGSPTGETINGAIAAARQHAIPIEPLTASEAESRFPGMRFHQNHAVLFEPRAGFLRVEACINAHLEAARASGATLWPETPVHRIEIEANGVRIHTAQAVLTAPRLVVAAGAWTGPLLADLAIPLVPSRKFVGWFDVTPGAYHVDRGYPCFYAETHEGSFYGFPSLDGQVIKVAEHSGVDPVADPSLVDRACRPEDLPRLTTFLQQMLPHATSRLSRHSVCLYTMSPDSHFLIDHLPQAPHVTVACGFSGHGFKFTSVIGEVLADLSLRGKSSLPVGFLSLKRFAAG